MIKKPTIISFASHSLLPLLLKWLLLIGTPPRGAGSIDHGFLFILIQVSQEWYCELLDHWIGLLCVSCPQFKISNILTPWVQPQWPPWLAAHTCVGHSFAHWFVCFSLDTHNCCFNVNELCISKTAFFYPHNTSPTALERHEELIGPAFFKFFLSFGFRPRAVTYHSLFFCFIWE